MLSRDVAERPDSAQASIFDFDDPPVTEVALSFGFLEVDLHAGHIGRFWDAVRDDFPVVEHQPPYAMPPEPLDLEPVAATPQIELLSGPPMPRVWLKNPTGTKLIQVQSNWFAFNWRKVAGDEEYPRYPFVEGEFRRYANLFVEFIAAEGLGDIAVTQCEVTYVNHIAPPSADLSHVDQVLSIVRPGSGRYLPVPQQVRHSSIYSVRVGDRPVGRLHVSANPGFKKSDSQPIIQLSLTVRGYPHLLGVDRTNTDDAVVAFLRLGREWIVNGFYDVTTAEMHRKWGLK
jgi:uncharacterized protein (TIGR04255 family)